MATERIPAYTREATFIDRDGNSINLHEFELQSIGFSDQVTQRSQPNNDGADKMINNKRFKTNGSLEIGAEGNVHNIMRGGDCRINDWRPSGAGSGRPNWSFGVRVSTRTITYSGEEAVMISADMDATTAVAKTTQ